MGSLLELTVDGKKTTVPSGDSLLKALQDKGFSIPSLCFHPALKSTGSCGLCIIEILVEGAWQIKPACTLQPQNDLKIRTTSDKIKKMRAVSASILLKRGPFRNKHIEEMLLNFIDEGNGYPSRATEVLRQDRTKGCILCGLCIRACNQFGKKHLTYLGRGKNLRIGFVTGSGDITENPCGLCKACRSVCPTGYIDSEARNVFRYPIFCIP